MQLHQPQQTSLPASFSTHAGWPSGAPTAPRRFLLVTAEFKPETIDRTRLEPGQYDGLARRGRQRAKELSARFADWYYVISDEVFQKIHLRCEHITTKKD